MSDFRTRDTVSDRSSSDRRRHKEKIDKALKEAIHDVVSEESIISSDGKKKIRIPVKGIKEYRFIYDDGDEKNGKSGTAPGKDLQKGQKIGESNKQKVPGTGPGNEPGEEYYDVEVTLEELATYLFEDLKLPDLVKKSIKKIISEKWKRDGYRTQGIIPRIDKKKSAIQRLKRLSARNRVEETLLDEIEPSESENMGFRDEDLVYKHFDVSKKYASNAVVFFIMDVSGSMSKEKKFLARSFFFLLFHFIKSKYQHVELVFIAHDTSAYEVNEQQFFTRGDGGGTIVSSALEMTNSIMMSRYHPGSWNVYAFQCSDGDNWSDDTEKASKILMKLKENVQLFGYCEIETEKRYAFDTTPRLSEDYKKLADDKLKIALIKEKGDIWKAFNKMFGGQINA